MGVTRLRAGDSHFYIRFRALPGREQFYLVRLIQNWVVFSEERPEAINRFWKLP